jgi:serine/threonine protein kinase
VSDDGAAQLNDFGISHIVDVQGFMTKIKRNIRFTAPELMPIDEIESDVKSTFETDIFSLAILLLQVCLCSCQALFQIRIVTVCHPQLFHGPDQNVQNGLPYNHIRLRSGGDYDLRLLRLIHQGERPRREGYRAMADQHWALLESCWRGDPSARPGISDVLKIL